MKSLTKINWRRILLDKGTGALFLTPALILLLVLLVGPFSYMVGLSFTDLSFFNLLPIPPLDGSHVARSLIGMSHETYHHIARYGIFILIIVLQIPLVQRALDTVTTSSWLAIAGWFGLPLSVKL